MDFAYVLAAGFLLGVEHAFDADHVVAVSTIVSEQKNMFKSAFLGITWGLGHTLTLLVAGLLVIFLKLSIPKSVETMLEGFVGLMLVALGIYTIYSAIKWRIHSHAHSHGHSHHRHFHASHEHGHHKKRSFIVGMVHGFAGSGALMLLVLGTVDSAIKGILYIAVFGIGSVLSMMLVTALIGIPFALTSIKFSGMNTFIRVSAGIVGIVVGSLVLHSSLSIILLEFS